MKNKIILGLIIMISPLFLLAHNPLSAKYYFEVGKKVSLLNINLSQTGLEQTMIKEYSLEKLNKLSRTEYKELIVDYLKNNFSLNIDDNIFELKEGGIKLGSHQTDLKFVLPPLTSTSTPKELTIDIPAFSDNENHQSIFSYKINEYSNKVILSEKNNFQAKISLIGSRKSWSKNWYYILGLTILLTLYLIWARYKKA